MHSASRIICAWAFTLAVGLIIVSCATEVGRQKTGLSDFQRQTPTPPLSPAAMPDAATQATVQAAYGKLPLHFETNQGQSDEQVKFLARGSGYTLFLTATEAVLALRQKPESRSQEPEADPRPLTSDPQPPSVLRMQLVGANPAPRIEGLEELPGKSHYFFGTDPAQWHTNIPTYAKVKYENVYPGVDLVYYGNQQQLEYDFVVAPGADPTVIRLAFGSVGAVREPPLHIDTTGDLVLHTADSEIRFHQPRIYQDIEGSKQLVSGHYVLLEPDTPDSRLQTPDARLPQVGFEVAAYDLSKPLIIDPVLSHTVALGNVGVSDIAVDATGAVYVTGAAYTVDLPTTPGAFQRTCQKLPEISCADAFVLKLDPASSSLVYSTYLGGRGGEGIVGLAVDDSGNAYVAGSTSSADLPTTRGAFQAQGGIPESCHQIHEPNCDRAFVAKLNETGSALVYATYLGGQGGAGASGLAVDAAGNAYVAGRAAGDFPTTNQAFNRNGPGAFVANLNPTGSALTYATFLSGFGSTLNTSIAVDRASNAYIAGITTSPDFFTTVDAFQRTCPRNQYGTCWKAFVTKLNAAGSEVIYSTYLGGNGQDSASAIAVDAIGNAYITGNTLSSDFPTVDPPPGSSCRGGDAFVSKLNASGTALLYSTCLGGSGRDEAFGIAIDTIGNAYVTGTTDSPDFPAVDAFQNGLGIGSCWFGFGGFGPCSDAFVTKLNAQGNGLLYSTYLGSSGPSSGDTGYAIAVDGAGNAYVGGLLYGKDFPIADPFQQGLPAFIAKIADTPLGTRANFESPENGPVSGITVIRGWAFATEPDVHISSVKLFIDGQSAGEVPCCSARGDVQAAFPQFPADNTLNSGWGTVFNWGLASAGTHTVRLFIRSTSGELFVTDTRTVTVVKPGDSEYLDQFALSGATARIDGAELVVEGAIVRDKVSQEQQRINARFRWFESSQSFGMVAATTVAQVSSLRALFAPLFASFSTWLGEGPVIANAQGLLQPTGFLESPEQEQVVAGIGVIRGWAFDEVRGPIPAIGLVIDGQWSGHIPCCSDRADVAAAFPGQSAALHSGWGTVVNYGLLSAGHHTVGVTAEYFGFAKFLDTHNVPVVRLGGFEFLDKFDLSGATARIEGENIILSGVVVRDKASQQSKTVEVWLRWFESAQGLGIVAAGN